MIQEKETNRSIKTIYFATSNHHKYEEVKREFTGSNFYEMTHLKVELIEIQSHDLHEIAKQSIILTPSLKNVEIVFVEDSGIFIQALNNFPGPFSAQTFSTIGLKGILKLMEGIKDRTAYFMSVIALKVNNKIITFEGKVNGTISTEISPSGWGYDPIFIPAGEKKTFGELGAKKLQLSHRHKSTMKMINYLDKIH